MSLRLFSGWFLLHAHATAGGIPAAAGGVPAAFRLARAEATQAVYVSSAVGSDASGDGSEAKPFASLSHTKSMVQKIMYVGAA